MAQELSLVKEGFLKKLQEIENLKHDIEYYGGFTGSTEEEKARKKIVVEAAIRQTNILIQNIQSYNHPPTMTIVNKLIPEKIKSLEGILNEEQKIKQEDRNSKIKKAEVVINHSIKIGERSLAENNTQDKEISAELESNQSAVINEEKKSVGIIRRNSEIMRKNTALHELTKFDKLLLDILKNPADYDYANEDVQKCLKLSFNHPDISNLFIFSVKYNHIKLFNAINLATSKDEVEEKFRSKNNSIGSPLLLSIEHTDLIIAKNLIPKGYKLTEKELRHCLLKEGRDNKTKVDIIFFLLYSPAMTHMRELFFEGPKPIFFLAIELSVGDQNIYETILKFLGPDDKKLLLKSFSLSEAGTQTSIELAAQKGYDLTPPSTFEETPQNKMRKQFFSLFANIYKKDGFILFRENLEELRKNKDFDINQKDTYGLTLLHRVIFSGRIDFLHYLLSIPEIDPTIITKQSLYLFHVVTNEKEGLKYLDIDYKKIYRTPSFTSSEKIYSLNILIFLAFLFKFEFVGVVNKDKTHSLVIPLLECIHQKNLHVKNKNVIKGMSNEDLFLGIKCLTAFCISQYRFSWDEIKDFLFFMRKKINDVAKDEEIISFNNQMYADILGHIVKNNCYVFLRFLLGGSDVKAFMEESEIEYVRTKHNLFADTALEHGFKQISAILEEREVKPTPSALAIHYVKTGNQPKLLELLNSQKNLVNTTDSQGYTLSVIALKNNQRDIYSNLINYPDADTDLGAGEKSVLYFAINQNDASLFPFLFDRLKHKKVPPVGTVNYNYLYMVVSKADLNTQAALTICKHLVENKAPLNLKDKETQKTAFYLAAENGWNDICQYLLENNVDYTSGIKYNEDGPEIMPMDIAIQNGHWRVVELLQPRCRNVDVRIEEPRNGYPPRKNT